MNKSSVEFPKWFSKKLIDLIHEKEYYFKMKRKTGNIIFIDLFNKKRREIKHEKKRSILEYQKNLELLIKTNPRSFFFIHEITEKIESLAVRNALLSRTF